MKNFEHYKRGYYMPPEKSVKWVEKEYIDKAPIWCSVDLRDGNQALIVPMNLDEKLEFFKELVRIGFKEIEIGFPAASETEYEFCRTLIEKNMIPDDVTIQVLTQARPHIIKKTFEAIDGAKHAIVHLYNSTSYAQRTQVFKKSKEEILQLAVDGAKLLNQMAEEHGVNYPFEYSPESFTGTEIDYALDVCNAVIKEWKPTPDRKVIINLPATVEMSLPHVYASQIEYMSEHLIDRENVILSLHPHNDRGCGVADAELGMLAGADRIEGTLFGNGERTGNVDIITLAMNMFTHGVDPELDLSDIPKLTELYERVTNMHVYERSPYTGKLVFAAFSGSHQDAINKGIQAMKERNDGFWEVPYLPVDPSDLGREYEPIVRINSQSGRGGVAFVMDTYFGYKLPKGMQKEFADVIQVIAEQHGEVAPDTIMEKFREEYLTYKTDREYPYTFDSCKIEDVEETDKGDTQASMNFKYKGEEKHVKVVGNGPIDAVKNALHQATSVNFKINDYSEHALGEGSNAKAAAYICVTDLDTKKTTYGVGVSTNITRASIRALFSALNRLAK